MVVVLSWEMKSGPWIKSRNSPVLQMEAGNPYPAAFLSLPSMTLKRSLGNRREVRAGTVGEPLSPLRVASPPQTTEEFPEERD